ncbi:MAG TPA: MFS transporter [Solirubrobacteraceae bacterium]|nr:MFS transporter [Solirubrobacteraceae bacterium]
MSTTVNQPENRNRTVRSRLRMTPRREGQAPAREGGEAKVRATARHADAQMTISAAQVASSDRRRWVALAVLCLGQLMMVLDSTIVNVALPSIQHDLHFSQGSLTWVMNGYLITFGGFLLLAGRLGDLVGRKKVFLTGLVMFTAASVLCGVAQDQTMLIVARLLQGVGGAVASAVILAIIVTEFPEAKDQAKAMGLYAFVSAGGGSIGLLAGGALTQSLDWHWIFFVNVPIGIVAFLAGSALIEENEGLGLRGGVDVLGSLLITLATMAGAFAIVKSTEYGLLSARTLGVGGGSLVLLASFLWLESRLENPIMPLRILRLRALMGSSLVRGLLITGMFSAFFLGSLYLERVLGYDAISTGLAFLPLTAAIAVMSMGVSAKIVERAGGVNTLAGGLVGIIAGLVLLATQGVHAGYFPGLFFAFLLLGLGAGASFLPLLTIGMSDAPKQDAGLASGIVNVSVQLFGAIGLATMGTIATDHTKALSASGHALTSALTGGYHLAYVVAAICVAFGILAAVVTLRPPRSGVVQEVEEELERDFGRATGSAQTAEQLV